jgi:hypothetical protein
VSEANEGSEGARSEASTSSGVQFGEGGLNSALVSDSDGETKAENRHLPHDRLTVTLTVVGQE